MKLKISLLVFLIGSIGIWYSIDQSNDIVNGSKQVNETGIINLGLIFMGFCVIESAGVIMCIIYGWKALTKYLDKKKETKSAV